MSLMCKMLIDDFHGTIQRPESLLGRQASVSVERCLLQPGCVAKISPSPQIVKYHPLIKGPIEYLAKFGRTFICRALLN